MIYKVNICKPVINCKVLKYGNFKTGSSFNHDFGPNQVQRFEEKTQYQAEQ